MVITSTVGRKSITTKKKNCQKQYTNGVFDLHSGIYFFSSLRNANIPRSPRRGRRDLFEGVFRKYERKKNHKNQNNLFALPSPISFALSRTTFYSVYVGIYTYIYIYTTHRTRRRIKITKRASTTARKIAVQIAASPVPHDTAPPGRTGKGFFSDIYIYTWIYGIIYAYKATEVAKCFVFEPFFFFIIILWPSRIQSSLNRGPNICTHIHGHTYYVCYPNRSEQLDTTTIGIGSGCV